MRRLLVVLPTLALLLSGQNALSATAAQPAVSGVKPKHLLVAEAAAAYWGAHPSDFTGLSRAIEQAGGDTVRFSVAGAEGVPAEQAQRAHNAAVAGTPTMASASVPEIPVDAFQVSAYWYRVQDQYGEWWNFTGSWQFKNGYSEPNPRMAPDDASAVRIKPETPTCWKYAGDYLWAWSRSNEPKHGDAYRKDGGEEESVWGLRATEYWGSVLTHHGQHMVSYKKIGSCTDDLWGRYFLEHNILGNGSWSYSFGASTPTGLSFNVNYSPPDLPDAVLKKSTDSISHRPGGGCGETCAPGEGGSGGAGGRGEPIGKPQTPVVRGGGTVGDLTGDGKADVLTVHGDDLYLYPGNGSSLGERSWIGYGWGAGIATINVADVTGDGKADVVATTTSGDMYLYPGNGTSLGERSWIGYGWGAGIATINVADVTGDGKADVVTTTTSGDMYLYPGNGSSLGARSWIGNGWKDGWANLNAGDITGDGKADVVAITTSGDMYLYPGNGSSLGARSWIGNGWTAGIAVVDLGDMTGDSKADVVMVDNGGNMFLYPSNGSSLGARSWIGNGWTGHRVGG